MPPTLRVHLTEGQPDPQADPTGPNLVPQLTIIAVVLTNTDMWKVQNGTILEG